MWQYHANLQQVTYKLFLWDLLLCVIAALFSWYDLIYTHRVQKLKGQFANFYVVVSLSTKEQNDSFVRSYFKWVGHAEELMYFQVDLFATLESESKELLMSAWIYSRYGMELGKPTFVPVQDREMGFEKIVKIALSRGGNLLVCTSFNRLHYSLQIP